MSKLFPLLMLGLAALMVFLVMTRRPLLRGFNGEAFVSTGRPPLVVTPAAGLHLAGGGVLDISPATASGTASARAWYGLYVSSDGLKRLTVLLAEAGDQWQWPHDVTSGLPEVRVDRREMADMPVTVATFALQPVQDPWHALWEATPPAQDARNGTLVRRFTFLPDMRRTKLVLEYREPLPPEGESPLPPLDDVANLVAFGKRAEASFMLEKPEQGKAPEVRDRPGTAPKSLERRAVAKWLGELERRHGEQR